MWYPWVPLESVVSLRGFTLSEPTSVWVLWVAMNTRTQGVTSPLHLRERVNGTVIACVRQHVSAAVEGNDQVVIPSSGC